MAAPINGVPLYFMVGNVIVQSAGPPPASNCPGFVLIGAILLTIRPVGPLIADLVHFQDEPNPDLLDCDGAGPGTVDQRGDVPVAVGPEEGATMEETMEEEGPVVGPEEEYLQELNEEEDTPPNCNWKTLGYVTCLICTKKITKLNKKSLMEEHYSLRHKGNSFKKCFKCSKCGQLVEKGHKCSVPKGYQNN